MPRDVLVHSRNPACPVQRLNVLTAAKPFVVKKRLKIFENFVPQFPNMEMKTRNGREQAQIGNNNKSVPAENREQSRTMPNFETCSFRSLLAVTRHQFAF